jgi:hypothetical protein
MTNPQNPPPSQKPLASAPANPSGLPFLFAELRAEMNTRHTEGLAVLTSEQLTTIEEHVAAVEQERDEAVKACAWESGDPDALAGHKALFAKNRALRARIQGLEELIRWAHDTLYEINPSNYDHDEVCKINDASVEVILGLAPTLGETHGKSPEWWIERAALNKDEKHG